jgi:hypothetical protein
VVERFNQLTHADFFRAIQAIARPEVLDRKIHVSLGDHQAGTGGHQI